MGNTVTTNNHKAAAPKKAQRPAPGGAHKDDHHHDPMHTAHKVHTVVDRVGGAAEKLEHICKPMRPALVPTPATAVPLKPPVVAAPILPPARPPVAPLPEPRTGGMSEMVDNMRRNGMLAQPQTQPLRQATTPEFSQMLDNMRRNGVISEECGRVAKPTPPAAPAPAPAPEVPHQPHSAGPWAKTMQVADKVLHPLNVVLGGYQAYEGAHKLGHAGNVKEGLTGALDVVGGTANTVSGVAGSVTALTSLTTASTVAGVSLGSITGVGAGIALVADGVKTTIEGMEIKDGSLKVTDGFKVAGGIIKTAGGGMVIAGVLTGNPALIVGGGVTYLAGLGVEHAREIGDFVDKTATKVAHEVEGFVSDVGSAISSIF